MGNHDWIKNKAPKAAAVSLQQNFVDNLKSFRSQNKLKKAALHIIAGQLNEGQIKKLRETFMALDNNGDGLLTTAELKEGIQKSGLKEIPEDLQNIIEGIDSDGSGQIDYTEFIAATLEKKQYLEESTVWAAFRVFDRNGDGKISPEELRHVLGDEDVKNMFSTDVDTSGDGLIDFQEFMEMMKKEEGNNQSLVCD